MTTVPSLDPEHVTQLLRTLRALDPGTAFVRPGIALGLVGVALAIGLGKVQEAVRRTPPAVRGTEARPSVGPGAPQTDGHGAGRRGTRKVVRDAADIAEQQREERTSYWGDILVERSVILWHGPYKTGKSTLLTEGLKHIIRGQPYLGWKTTKTAAVYFSEETSEIWQDKAAGIAGVREPACPWWQAWMPPGPLYYGPIRRPSLLPRWVRRMRGYRSVFHVEGPSVPQLRGIEHVDALMAYADGTARAVGAAIIILDTLKHFCSEAQSASEHADTFINAVKGLAARGYCVIIVHHDNDDGKPLGSKSLPAGVDALVHQHRIKGLPEKASDREVEFEGRFRLGGAPEALRYRLDPQTVEFIRVDTSAIRTPSQTQTDSPRPLELPVRTPPVPLRVVVTPPGRDALCQAILMRLVAYNGSGGTSTGPWSRTDLVQRILSLGVLKSRAAAYAHVAHLVADGWLTDAGEGRVALKAADTASA